MYRIYAQWLNGQVEEVDEADNLKDARFLVQEYRMAYGEAARKVWFQKG